MNRWIFGLVTVAALVVGAATASAQGYGGHGRNGGHGGGHAHGGHVYGGYSPGLNIYGGGYSYGNGGFNLSIGSGSRWHDTSHYDYHPATVRRHRGHLDYVPAYYDFHRSGHRH